MPVEIERKFLVRDKSVLDDKGGEHLRQGYLAQGAVAVRVRRAVDKAWLTLKTREAGAARQEFEYAIPIADADAMLKLPGVLGVLSKRRFVLLHKGLNWDVDVYEGALQGLVTAEVEIPAVDTPVDVPAWAGPEVTHRQDFSNEALACKGLPLDWRDLLSKAL